jgi:hypothetical protein
MLVSFTAWLLTKVSLIQAVPKIGTTAMRRLETEFPTDRQRWVAIPMPAARSRR